MSMENLPDLVMSEVFAHLCWKDRIRLETTCARWHRLLRRPGVRRKCEHWKMTIRVQYLDPEQDWFVQTSRLFRLHLMNICHILWYDMTDFIERCMSEDIMCIKKAENELWGECVTHRQKFYEPFWTLKSLTPDIHLVYKKQTSHLSDWQILQRQRRAIHPDAEASIRWTKTECVAGCKPTSNIWSNSHFTTSGLHVQFTIFMQDFLLSWNGR